MQRPGPKKQASLSYVSLLCKAVAKGIVTEHPDLDAHQGTPSCMNTRLRRPFRSCTCLWLGAAGTSQGSLAGVTAACEA